MLSCLGTRSSKNEEMQACCREQLMSFFCIFFPVTNYHVRSSHVLLPWWQCDSGCKVFSSQWSVPFEFNEGSKTLILTKSRQTLLEKTCLCVLFIYKCWKVVKICHSKSSLFILWGTTWSLEDYLSGSIKCFYRLLLTHSMCIIPAGANLHP